MTFYTIVSYSGDPRCFVRVLPVTGGYEECGEFAGSDRVQQARAFAAREYPDSVELTEGEFERAWLRCEQSEAVPV